MWSSETKENITGKT